VASIATSSSKANAGGVIASLEVEMSKNKITDKVSLSCQNCGSEELLSLGAVRTVEDKVFFIYQCGCGNQVPIDVDGVVSALFSVTPAKKTH